jgi:hypothetical protein
VEAGGAAAPGSQRKRSGVCTAAQVEADAPKVVWALDFQFDSTIDGKAVKIASMLDEHTRESLLNIVERSITTERLIAELKRVFAAAGGPPLVLRMDNGPELISQALYEVLGAVYDRLGFDVVDDAVLRDLVIARIVEPAGKADSMRVLADLGSKVVSYRTIQRRLAQIGPGKYRDLIATKCFAHAGDTGGLSVILYDVTTLYFEVENEDELRKVGFSKERRVDPQVAVGLLVDRSGFPLEISCFDGATVETHTIVPVIEAFCARHGINHSTMVVAADAGMLSASNLKDLDGAGLSFIVGSHMTKAPNDLESHFHWNGEVFTGRQIIDTVTPRHSRSCVNNLKLRA